MGTFWYNIGMNVISRRTLIEFYEKHADSKTPLEVWYADAKRAEWKTPADIKQYDRSASFVGDNRVIFNIKGNDYRLIVHVVYRRGALFIKFIGTHGEYDKIDAEKVGL